MNYKLLSLERQNSARENRIKQLESDHYLTTLELQEAERCKDDKRIVDLTKKLKMLSDSLSTYS